jgi:hypothetical protein
MAASSGDKATAQSELKAALVASSPGDEYWTAAAEVYAILDSPAVVAAIEQAAKRREPTGTYILNNPLFGYLQSDAKFQKVAEQLRAQPGEIRAALAKVSL